MRKKEQKLATKMCNMNRMPFRGPCQKIKFLLNWYLNWENVHKLPNPWCTLLNSLASPLQHISLQAEWAALGLQWLVGSSLIHSATPLPQVKHSTHHYIHTTLFRRAEKRRDKMWRHKTLSSAKLWRVVELFQEAQRHTLQKKRITKG